MATWFGGSKPKTVKSVKTVDAEAAKAQIDRERRRSTGGFQSTIVGSGLKTALGQ